MKLDRQFRKPTPEEEAKELMAQFDVIVRQVQEREAKTASAAQAAGARVSKHTGIIAHSLRPPRTQLYRYWKFTRRLRIIQDLYDTHGIIGYKLEPHLWLEVISHNNGTIYRRIAANMYPDLPIEVKHIRVSTPSHRALRAPTPVDLSKMFLGDWTNAAFRYDHDRVPQRYYLRDVHGIVAKAEITLPSKLEDYKHV